MDEREMLVAAAGDIWLELAPIENRFARACVAPYTTWFRAAGEPRSLPHPDVLYAECARILPRPESGRYPQAPRPDVRNPRKNNERGKGEDGLAYRHKPSG